MILDGLQSIADDRSKWKESYLPNQLQVKHSEKGERVKAEFAGLFLPRYAAVSSAVDGRGRKYSPSLINSALLL